MNRYFAYAIVGLVLFISSPIVEAQNVSRKRGGDLHKAYTDSLKATPYPWRFPILGAKLRKMGFDIPYPTGFMVNYIIGSQYITLDNLNVGPSPDNLTNVDGLARFESIIPFVNVVNLRYDVWLFPFLNVYALGGYVHSVTDVNLALPFSTEFTSISNGPMAGWGMAAAAGVGPIFFSADYNMAWTFMPQLDGPSVAKVFDIRVGHTFNFKNKLESNISIMAGAQYLKLNPHSTGSADLSKMAGISQEDKEKALDEFNSWFGDLPPNLQQDLDGFYNTIEGWLSNQNDTYVYYEFDKKLYYPWSMTVGLNYQINHRHILMGLYTFLGSREQFVLSYNYRFGFKGKNLFSGVEF